MKKVKWFELNENQKLEIIGKAIKLLPESLLRDNVTFILNQSKEKTYEGALDTLRFLILEEVNLHWKEDKGKKEILEVLCDGLER